MARYTGPVCRRCRRAGMKLYLKGVRCETAKCAIEKQWRNKPPGMHFWRRRRQSEYGVRLREKQKLRWYYGVLEKQFRRFFEEAARGKGSTGDRLLILMERRLDNVVYRLGFAPSRNLVRAYIESEEDRLVPQWLEADPERFRGDVKVLPTRDDVSIQINDQLIVEFCSR